MKHWFLELGLNWIAVRLHVIDSAGAASLVGPPPHQRIAFYEHNEENAEEEECGRNEHNQEESHHSHLSVGGRVIAEELAVVNKNQVLSSQKVRFQTTEREESKVILRTNILRAKQ